MTWNQFEGLLTEPDTMGVVPRTEGLAFLASPRRASHGTVARGVAVTNPTGTRGNVKKGDVSLLCVTIVNDIVFLHRARGP